MRSPSEANVGLITYHNRGCSATIVALMETQSVLLRPESNSQPLPCYTVASAPRLLSIVIPIHNEERSILPLYDRLAAVLESLQRPYEIIFVDDASCDRSFELLANLVETDYHLKVIRLRRNFGQT